MPPSVERAAAGKLSFQTASGETLPHLGSRSVLYNHTEAGQLGLNFEVTDVHEPVASVSAMNDAGFSVVFTPTGSWITPARPERANEALNLKRSNGTFWLEMDRDKGPQKPEVKFMPLKEQMLAEAPIAEGNPAVAERQAEQQEKDRHPQSSSSGLARPLPEAGEADQAEVSQKQHPRPAQPSKEEVANHDLSHVVYRNWCKWCMAARARDEDTIELR